MSEENASTDKFCEVPTERCVVGSFGAASFLNDMGSDIVFSIWPIFVGLLGGNPFFLGLIDGIGDFVVNVSKGFSGFLSDTVEKRKPFIWGGYLAGGFSRIIYGLAPTWHWLLPAKILDRAGKVRGAPRDALVADVSSMETRGRNFGILRTLDHTGAVLGILITVAFITFLFPWLNIVYGFDLRISLQLLFLIASIPTLIGAILILAKVSEFRKTTGKPQFQIQGISRSLIAFIVLSMIFAFGFFSFSFVTLYGGLYLVLPTINPLLSVPFAYLIFTVTAALTSAPLGRLGDAIGRRPTIFIGFVLYALMCLIFVFWSNFWSVFFALILYGASIGATVPMQRSLVAELAQVDVRASVLGLYQMLIGIAALPANTIAGLLWLWLGPATPFLLSLGLTAFAAILLIFVRESKPQS
jgi:MFS family permease